MRRSAEISRPEGWWFFVWLLLIAWSPCSGSTTSSTSRIAAAPPTTDGALPDASATDAFLKLPLLPRQRLGGPPPQQMQVLNSMFDHTSRDVLGWYTYKDVCKKWEDPGWEGITCNQEGTSIVGINVQRVEGRDAMSGTLPDLSPLKDLATLSLSGNALTGTVPAGLPASLKVLDLSSNFLSGSIPDISELINIRRYDLSTNVLTGTLPSVGNLTMLNTFSVENNQLTGMMPDGIDSLPNLATLSMFGNSLSGELPEGLGDPDAMPSLQTLYVYGNRFSGTVPHSLAMSVSIQRLYLDTNQFSGKVPVFAGLASGSLQRVTLANNEWKCPLPGMNDSVWIDAASTTCVGDDLLIPVWLLILCCALGGACVLGVLAYCNRRALSRCCAKGDDLKEWDTLTPSRPTESRPVSVMHGSGVSFPVPVAQTAPQSAAASHASGAQQKHSHDPTVSLFAGVSSHLFAEPQDIQDTSPAHTSLERSQPSSADASPIPVGLLDSWNDLNREPRRAPSFKRTGSRG